MNVYDVLIIGGGAAGYFTAVNTAEKLPNAIVDFKKNLYLSLLKEIKLVID